MVEAGEVVEYIDPGWRDHFRDVGDAADFYRTHSPDEWRQAVKELS